MEERFSFKKWVCRTGGNWRDASPVIAKDQAVLPIYIPAKDILPALHY